MSKISIFVSLLFFLSLFPVNAMSTQNFGDDIDESLGNVDSYESVIVRKDKDGKVKKSVV
jgi:hypothetical protein